MSREFFGGAQIYNLSPVCHYLLLHLGDNLLLPPALQLGLLLLSSDPLHLLFGLQTSLAFLLELFGTRLLLGPLLFLGLYGGCPRSVASELRNLLSQLLNVRLVVVLDLGEQGGDDRVLPAEDL